MGFSDPLKTTIMSFIERGDAEVISRQEEKVKEAQEITFKLEDDAAEGVATKDSRIH